VALPSEIYTREYFESDYCEGWAEFSERGELSRLKRYELGLLDLRTGLRVLDAGCGRGEVLAHCARAGARVAGLDYADAAVEIARETLSGVEGAEVVQGDVTALPWDDGAFDRVLFADVIEHLDPPQAAAALGELLRVLAPGGALVVHTAPNRLFLSTGWPLARPALRLLGRGSTVAKVDAWIAESKRFHVNEQSPGDLRRGLRDAGFAGVRAWIGSDVARDGDHHLTSELGGGAAIGAGARIAALPPLRTIFGNDLYATGRRP
jgi:ubiquinone/menaquinone biosynthesis C-methylase UbiE